MLRKCLVLHLDTVDYADALGLQDRLVRERQEGTRGDTLVLLQHPPVLTLGRRADPANILAPRDELKNQGISVYEANRGGDVTYHGPGQLVGYPILKLADHGNDVYGYLRMLEEAIMVFLKGYGIDAGRQDGYTGVWLGRDKKIAAIGVAIKGGVTMHGFALNVDPNLQHFSLINPCGYTDRGVTSMSAELHRSIDFTTVQLGFPQAFGRVFGTHMTTAES